MAKPTRDVESTYDVSDVVAKLRRLADALETQTPFRIQVAGERIRVPGHARFSIEHERDTDHEEVEFQLTWSLAETSEEDSAPDEANGDVTQL